MIGAGLHASKFGLWVNTTKVFKALKSVVCRKYFDYAQRALVLSKKIVYPEYGSGILRSVLGFGRVDYSIYKTGVQYFNNKTLLKPLSDYFAYSQVGQYTLPVVLYPESNFERVEHTQEVKPYQSTSEFDLTLFESRTAFWESYIGTPTSKLSFLKTEFKTIASNILVTPVTYKDTFTTFSSQLTPLASRKNNLIGSVSSISLNSLRKRYFRKS